MVHNILGERNVKEINYEVIKKTLTLFPERWCSTNVTIYWKMPAPIFLKKLCLLKESNTIRMRRWKLCKRKDTIIRKYYQIRKRNSEAQGFRILKNFLFHGTFNSKSEATPRHLKRQMKTKEAICIMKLSIQKQHQWICHKHHPYSNNKAEGSICQSSSMLTTWRSIFKILDIWAI